MQCELSRANNLDITGGPLRIRMPEFAEWAARMAKDIPAGDDVETWLVEVELCSADQDAFLSAFAIQVKRGGQEYLLIDDRDWQAVNPQSDD